ncbi:DNA polymerase III PolC-type [Corynebacterium kalinowskii]|uniref:DNA polymerase III PolC-type n=1 Tax=Corynebacterium kalinowskii TaxID=2675216 RepID=A0A6B8VR62_9CORY|nr:exonuclease domain-containing protein [Corynebacterium kalinowskii]QGU02351.1 DNA polymerase III PolC-type [Corynebacterium kalinowskii]
MIAAHGAQIDVHASGVDIRYSPLLTALHYENVTIALSEITRVEVSEPTTVLSGSVSLLGADKRIIFSPGQAEQARQLAAAIDAARHGESPAAVSPVPGLNFVAFDVETANADWGSICQMGAVRFVDGIPTDSVSWYVQPPQGLDEFDPDNVAIHGITPDQVADAPEFPDRLAAFIDFVGNDPLVAHNAQFDFTALSRASAASGIAAPTMYFGCTLLMCRAAKLGFTNNKLPTVAAGLGVDLTQHHDATADAAACGGILVELARRADYSGSFVEFCFSQGFTLGILEPSRVYPVLKDRSGAGVALQRKKLGLAVDKPAAAEVPAPADKPARSSSAPWSRVATPEVVPDPNPNADPGGALFGQNVTLTGDFAPFEKGDLWERIAAQGATIGKNVTKKTTILVCGPWATVTSKQKRAEELIQKGQKLTIWTEKQLYTALGLDEQPPF